MELTITSKDRWRLLLFIILFLLPVYFGILIVTKAKFFDYIFMSLYFITIQIFMIGIIENFYIEKLLLKNERYEKYNLLGIFAWIINGTTILMHLLIWYNIIFSNFIDKSILLIYMAMLLPSVVASKGKIYVTETDMYYGAVNISKSKIKNIRIRKNDLYIDLINSKNISMKCYKYKNQIVKSLTNVEV